MQIFGILNITEDSFFDGGKFLQLASALKKADELSQQADVIDIGAQSSNVDAEIISDELEWSRLEPVIDYLQKKKYPVSVDTYKPTVIQKCILKKINYINNIRAFVDRESQEVLEEYRTDLPNLVLMFSHNQGEKAIRESHLQPETVLDEVSRFLETQLQILQKISVPEEKVIVDPGMGFFLGQDPELSFTILREIHSLKKRFTKLMISVSRKSFLGKVLGGIPPKERGTATVVTELYAYLQGVDFIRTHDPLALRQAILIQERLRL